jgi:cell division protein FtsN
MPDPNLIEPQPQPVPGGMLPGQGASLPPSGFYFGGGAQPERFPTGTPAPTMGRTEEAVGNYPAPEIPRDVIAPKPQGFALSLAPVEIKPPVTITVEKPVNRKVVDRQNRIWAVQVAALADSKDAESMAAKLRKVGHQAYVLTTQVAEKIWHRVRIGKFESQNDAQDLRKTLATEKEYRQAYVATN